MGKKTIYRDYRVHYPLVSLWRIRIKVSKLFYSFALLLNMAYTRTTFKYRVKRPYIFHECTCLSPVRRHSQGITSPMLCLQMDWTDIYPPHFQSLIHFGLVIFHYLLCLLHLYTLGFASKTMMEISSEHIKPLPLSRSCQVICFNWIFFHFIYPHSHK